MAYASVEARLRYAFAQQLGRVNLNAEKDEGEDTDAESLRPDLPAQKFQKGAGAAVVCVLVAQAVGRCPDHS